MTTARSVRPSPTSPFDVACAPIARALLDGADEALPAWWGELASLGWLGLHLPEAHGGSGYGMEELVVVVEELGRAIAPGPFVPTVIASAVIAATGDDASEGGAAAGIGGRLAGGRGGARR